MIRLPTAIADRLKPFYDTRRVCVTGGAGFIGGHLVDALSSLGASVTVLDDLSNSSLDHLAGLIELDPAGVRFHHGSILEPDAIERAVDSASVVFHLAAICSVPLSVEQPGRTWEINATGTQRVLEAARQEGVKRVVFSASSSAYGNATAMPVDEQLIPSPLSPYAASKVAGELLASAYAESYGMSTVSLRYFNIFGPRQHADSPYSGVIPKFIDAAMQAEQLELHGDGAQSRDFTYVGNAVLANLLAGASDAPLSGQVLNVGTGVRTSIRELADRILTAFGRPKSDARSGPARRGDVLHSLADIRAAADTIGYQPITDTEDGLAMTFDWWRSRGSATPRAASQHNPE